MLLIAAEFSVVRLKVSCDSSINRFSGSWLTATEDAGEAEASLSVLHLFQLVN